MLNIWLVAPRTVSEHPGACERDAGKDPKVVKYSNSVAMVLGVVHKHTHVRSLTAVSNAWTNQEGVIPCNLLKRSWNLNINLFKMREIKKGQQNDPKSQFYFCILPFVEWVLCGWKTSKVIVAPSAIRKLHLSPCGKGDRTFPSLAYTKVCRCPLLPHNNVGWNLYLF